MLEVASFYAGLCRAPLAQMSWFACSHLIAFPANSPRPSWLRWGAVVPQRQKMNPARGAPLAGRRQQSLEPGLTMLGLPHRVSPDPLRGGVSRQAHELHSARQARDRRVPHVRTPPRPRARYLRRGSGLESRQGSRESRALAARSAPAGRVSYTPRKRRFV